MNWNQRITEKRTELKMSKVALSRKVGVSGATISDWESGVIKMIDGANLVKVAAVLNVRPEWIISGTGGSEPYAGTDDEIVAAINRFVSAYRAMTDEGRVFLDHAITAASSAYLIEDKRHQAVAAIIDRRNKKPHS